MNQNNPEIRDVPLIKVAVLTKRIAEQIPRLGGSPYQSEPITAATCEGEVLGYAEQLNDVLVRQPSGRLIRVHGTAWICRNGESRVMIDAAQAEIKAMRQLFLS